MNPKVIDDGGDPKLGSLTGKAAQSALYRPRLEKGLPVETPGVRLDQPFYVEAEDTTPAQPEASDQPPQSRA